MFQFLLIISALFFAVSSGLRAESSIEKLQSQTAQTIKSASGLSQAQMALSFILPKFYPDKDGNPALWKLVSNSIGSGKPRITVTEFVADQGVTNWAVSWSGKNYAVDKSGLAAIRKLEDLLDPNEEQDGFIGVSNLAGLTSSQAADYFGNDTSRFPASQDAVQKTPIKFKSISVGTDGLRYLNVQVGSLNVDLPVPIAGGWYQEAYIKAPNSDHGVLYTDSTGDYFGRSTGLSGDTLIVGAHWEDSNQTTITNGTSASSDNSIPDSGAIYVFKRTGSTWVQEAYLKSPNPDVDDRFGVSSGISGNTIVVGVRYEDSNQTTITNGTSASSDNSNTSSGAVFVFRRTGNQWAQEAYLKAPNADMWDDFGWVSGISGDTIVVGAWQEDSNQTAITNGQTASSDNSLPDSGAAYVFRRTNNNWVQEAYLKAPNADSADNFGSAVSVSGDTIIVSAYREDSVQSTITNGVGASSDNSNSDSGAVYVFRRTGNQWAQEAYLKASNSSANNNFGRTAQSISISNDTIVVGSLDDSSQTTITNGTTASFDNSKTDSGAAYVFKRTGSTWVQEAYLKASNADAGDVFGAFNYISGDTVAISAHLEASKQTTITNGPSASSDNSLLISGAAYLFRRSGSTWIQEAYFKAPNADAGDKFGVYPSISGDTLVVGAGLEDSNQTTITNGSTASSDNSAVNSGAVYVFRKAEVSMTPVITRVTPPTAFCPGNSINIFGSGFMKDATVKVGDQSCISQTTQGTNEIVCELPRQPVAIPGDSLDITVTNPNGEVSTLNDSFSCDGWYQEAYIKVPSSDRGDGLGRNLAISEDTLVVGSHLEDSNQTTITNGATASSDNSLVDSGAAFIFQRSGQQWSQTAFIKAPNASAGDRFASNVGLSADTIVVGAQLEDSNQTIITNGTTASSDNSLTDSGAAYVFRRTGNSWAQEAYIKASNPDIGDEFAQNRISISGDTIVISALYEDSNQTTITNGATASSDNSLIDSGAAYVFKRNGGTWSQEAYLKAANAGAFDTFSGADISGDTVVVGSNKEDSMETTVTNGAGASADNSLIDSGAAYVFRRSGSVWSQEAYLKAFNAGANDQFGINPAISGDTILIGAWYEDSNQTTITNGTTASSDNSLIDSGAAYVFRRTNGIWVQEAYLKASNAEAGDEFAKRPVISADTIIAQAQGEDSGQTTVTNGPNASADNSVTDTGAVYVFKRTGSHWVQEAYLKAPNPDPHDSFGRWLGISGDTVAVGASYEDSNQTTITNGTTASSDNSLGDLSETDLGTSGAGAVYVFRRPEKDATPNITSVTPNQVFCPGSSINIFGSGFMKNATASIDGVTCRTTTVQGPNEIICDTPASSQIEGAPLSITVTNPNGKSNRFLDGSAWNRNTIVDGKLSEWMAAGITVTKGTPFTVTASGTINIYSNNTGWDRSPDGSIISSTSTCVTSNTYPDGALLGKIGKYGTIFLVGSSFSTNSASSSGELYLIPNDSNCSSDNSGSFNVTITAPRAFNCSVPKLPTININQQPIDQTASNGSATFSISASVTEGATLLYQWQLSNNNGTTWSNLSNQTGSSLVLTGLTTTQNGYRYRVVLNSTPVNVSGLGSVSANRLESNAAVLSVPALTATCEPCGAPGGTGCYALTSLNVPKEVCLPDGTRAVNTNDSGAVIPIFREKNGNRVIKPTGFWSGSNDWLKKLNRRGDAFTNDDFTDWQKIFGRICPPSTFIDRTRMIETGYCLYYTKSDIFPEQTLDFYQSSGVEGEDWLSWDWSRSTSGAGATASYYEGNLKPCADLGMRLPTVYEIAISNPTTSTLNGSRSQPAGALPSDARPTWGTNFPSMSNRPQLFYWTATANAQSSAGQRMFWGALDYAATASFYSPRKLRPVCFLPGK